MTAEYVQEGRMQSSQDHEDRWVPTVCGRCYAACGIRVRVKNGVAIKIEGIPESTQGSRGGICAKGLSGLQVLYDPNRLNVPLKRTNPEKGIFADPKWKEISWDEALNEIATRLKEVVSKDPKRLLWQGTTVRPSYIMGNIYPILQVLGKPNYYLGGGGLHCGQGAHGIAGLVHGSWSIVPDFRYCNYAIYFGANKGGGSGHSAAATIRLAAEARARGMKLVVFDPVRIGASGKATEWHPIIPGTDGAVALAMCNVILNELSIFDDAYLKARTNGPYLIGPDGRYVRDKETGKPYVWDTADGKAKSYDDSTIQDLALEGVFEIGGSKVQTVFRLVRNHLKEYSCEKAAQISGVPEKKIRSTAVEFAKAASVGSTIVIDGHVLPYRPVSAVIFRGGEGHENSYHTCAAVCLLNQIVGAADVPGGTLGWTPVSFGLPETGKPAMHISTGKDGMLEVDRFGSTFGLRRPGPWPPREPACHGDPALHDLFPLSLHTPMYASGDQEEIWKKIGWNGGVEMLISWGANTIMNVGNRDTVAETLKKIPFIVVSELYSTELAEGFADILLPDTCYLEESDWLQGSGLAFSFPYGLDDWAYHILQPVVKPKQSRRNFIDVMWDIVERIGKWEELTEIFNRTYDLSEEYKFKKGEKFTRLDLCDRAVKSVFGSDHDWEWFKKNGHIRWPKRVEEAYWRAFTDCRVPIYLEHLLDIGEKAKPLFQKVNLDVDMDQYKALISWTPCSIHRVPNPEYDIYCFSYRDVLHTGSHTMEQPWLDEVSDMNPYTYNIVMNVHTAGEKGLKDGDTVVLESVKGREVTGRLKVMEGIHRHVAGIAACTGHWGKGMPIARGKGTNFDILLEVDLKHMDPVCLNMETAVRVKIRKKV